MSFIAKRTRLWKKPGVNYSLRVKGRNNEMSRENRGWLIVCFAVIMISCKGRAQASGMAQFTQKSYCIFDSTCLSRLSVDAVCMCVFSQTDDSWTDINSQCVKEYCITGKPLNETENCLVFQQHRRSLDDVRPSNKTYGSTEES